MATNIKEIAVGKRDLFSMKPEDLNVLDGWNSREAENPENAAHIEELAASIAQCGVKNPLSAFSEGGKFFVSDGHCRLAAVRLAMSRGAEIKSIPVLLEDRYASEADRVFSQIVRNGGKPLAPIEQARVFKRLLDLGWPIDDIAQKSGKGKQYVTSLLELQAAGPEVTAPVSRGEISASTATKALKANGSKKAGEVIKEAVEKAKASGKSKATAKHFKTETEPANFAANAIPAEALSAAMDAAPVGTCLTSFENGWKAAMLHRWLD